MTKQRTFAIWIVPIAVAGLWTLAAFRTSSDPPQRVQRPRDGSQGPAVVAAGGMAELRATSARLEPSSDPSQAHRERVRMLSAARALAGVPSSPADQLGFVETDFRTRFEADPEYAAYRACLATEHRCEEIFSNIVHSVLYGGFVNDLESGAFELPAEGTPEAAQVVAELALAITSVDPLKRATALVLSSRVDALFVRELPAEAYEGIAGLSVAEQQLLLGRHAFVPLPSDAVADEIAAFGRITKDSRSLSAAVLALGHPSTDKQLAGLLDDIAIDGEVRRDLSRVIGLCAGECRQTIRRMYESEQPDDRAALARAIDFCPETKVESLREVVREISSGELVLEMSQG